MTRRGRSGRAAGRALPGAYAFARDRTLERILGPAAPDQGPRGRFVPPAERITKKLSEGEYGISFPTNSEYTKIDRKSNV